jgi:hypothetical protein
MEGKEFVKMSARVDVSELSIEKLSELVGLGLFKHTEVGLEAWHEPNSPLYEKPRIFLIPSETV